jgi:hypothetical protein
VADKSSRTDKAVVDWDGVGVVYLKAHLQNLEVRMLVANKEHNLNERPEMMNGKRPTRA